MAYTSGLICVRLVGLVTVAAALYAFAGAAERDRMANTRILEQSTGLRPTGDLFSSLMFDAGQPAGIIRVEGCTDAVQAYRFTKEMTLENAVNALEVGDPRYHVDFSGEAANLVPWKIGAQSLLDTSIKLFQWYGDQPVALSVRQVAALPEVTARAGDLGLTKAPFSNRLAVGGEFGIGFRRAGIVVARGLPLRDVLNRIVTIRGRGVWDYSERLCHGLRTYSIQSVAE